MGDSLSEAIEIRAATAADVAAISRIMNYPPEPPLATMLGSRRASRLGDLLVRAGVNLGLGHTFVSVVDGKIAGVLDCGGRSAPDAPAASFLKLLPKIVVILGPVLPRAVYGMSLRRRVDFEALPDAFPIGGLYVDETLRNRGIGGRLLEHAEGLARGRWSRMCIETGITNPARRLYERHGYKVIATKTDTAYERLTGSPGRILMAKDL